MTKLLRTAILLLASAITTQAQPPVPDCPLLPGGLGGLLEPGTVVLLGELHGTNQSPRFLTTAACHALLMGHSVTVGLELPQTENDRIQQFVASEGTGPARDSLLTGPFWRRSQQDGRSSHAMLAAIDRIREYRSAGSGSIEVILIDDPDSSNRDSVMAAAVLDALESRPDDVFLILTGNVHNRLTVGTPWDDNYESTGYLLNKARPNQDVVALDVAHEAGQAWVCFPDGCGVKSLNGRGVESEGVTMYADSASKPHDGQYFVGPLTPSLPAIRFFEEPEFARFFEDAGVEGTFVLYDPAEDRYRVHNPERATRRFIPASTFKIPNSLIAIEAGVIADTSTGLEWDGRVREIPAWNRDHTMTSAIRYSVVWFYQELARRVGEARMDSLVSLIDYGNNDIGGGIDQFWLTGDLRISALEQIGFLERLANGELAFSEETLAAVRQIMIEDRGPDYILHGKTGWADWNPTDVGWYVGYVERDGGPYFFALNIDIEDPSQAELRSGIARAILTDAKLIN